jgi:hypothetical protein
LKKRRNTVKQFHRLVLAFALVLFANSAFAGQIVLTGTDIISLHEDHTANYAEHLFTLLGQASSKPILVYSNFSLAGNPNYTSATWAPGFVQTGVGTLSGIDFSKYAAVWLTSPGQCCGDPTSIMTAGDVSALAAFEAGGGSIGVENFLGAGGCGAGPKAGAWNAILGFDPSAGLFGTGCNDIPAVINAQASAHGLGNGFTGDGSGGPGLYTESCCWSHQTYLAGFWAPLGYNVDLLSGTGADPTLWNVMDKGFEGGHIVGAVPEPSSVFLMGTGLLGLALRLRKRK